MPPRQSAYARDHGVRIRYLAANAFVTNASYDRTLEELHAVRDARLRDVANAARITEEQQQQGRIRGLTHQAGLADLVDRVIGSIRQEGEDASRTVLANYRTEREKRKNASEKLEKANADVKSKNKELEKANADVKSKDTELGQLRKQLNDQEAKAIAAEEKSTDLHQQLNNQKTKATAAEKESIDLQQQLDHQKARVIAAENKSTDLQQQLDTQEEACKKEKEELRQTHKDKMENLQADQKDVLVDYDDEVVSLRETIEARGGEITRLNDDHGAKADELRGCIERLERSEQSLNNENAALRQEASGSNQRAETLQNHLEGSRGIAIELRSQLRGSRSSVSTMAAQLRESGNTASTLRNHLQKSENSVSTLQSDLDESRNTVATLESQLQESRERMSTLETQLQETSMQSARGQHSEAIQELHLQVGRTDRDHSTATRRLESDLGTARRERDTVREERDTVCRELEMTEAFHNTAVYELEYRAEQQEKACRAKIQEQQADFETRLQKSDEECESEKNKLRNALGFARMSAQAKEKSYKETLQKLNECAKHRDECARNRENDRLRCMREKRILQKAFDAALKRKDAECEQRVKKLTSKHMKNSATLSRRVKYLREQEADLPSEPLENTELLRQVKAERDRHKRSEEELRKQLLDRDLEIEDLTEQLGIHAHEYTRLEMDANHFFLSLEQTEAELAQAMAALRDMIKANDRMEEDAMTARFNLEGSAYLKQELRKCRQEGAKLRQAQEDSDHKCEEVKRKLRLELEARRKALKKLYVKCARLCHKHEELIKKDTELRETNAKLHHEHEQLRQSTKAYEEYFEDS